MIAWMRRTRMLEHTSLSSLTLPVYGSEGETYTYICTHSPAKQISLQRTPIHTLSHQQPGHHANTHSYTHTVTSKLETVYTHTCTQTNCHQQIKHHDNLATYSLISSLLTSEGLIKLCLIQIDSPGCLLHYTHTF